MGGLCRRKLGERIGYLFVTKFYPCLCPLTRYHCHLDDLDGSYLFAGPPAILESYEGVTTEPLQLGSYALESEGVHEKFLLSSLNEILTLRGNSDFPAGLSFLQIIVDRVIGESKCEFSSILQAYHLAFFCALGEYCHSDCPDLGPTCLYSETSEYNFVQLLVAYGPLYVDWDELKGIILLDWHFVVKGGLLCNKEESPFIDSKHLRSMNFVTLFRELLDSRQDLYSHWSKEKWACYECLSGFLRDNLLFWSLDRKRKG